MSRADTSTLCTMLQSDGLMSPAFHHFLNINLDEYPNSNCSAIFKWKDKSDFRGHLEKLCHLVHTYSGIIVISFTYC